MKRQRVMVLASMLLAIVIAGSALMVPALAQEPAPEPGSGPGLLGRRGFGPWSGSWDVYDAAAEALGLSPEQLFGELRAGNSLADIAAARDIDLDQVQEAMQAARQAATREAIQQAVADGRLTQAQADWMLQGLELGFMPRGHLGQRTRGLCNGLGPALPPSTTSSSNS